MSISVTTDVVCDECGHWNYGPTSGKKETLEARQMAKGAGWVHVNGEDICYRCRRLPKYRGDGGS